MNEWRIYKGEDLCLSEGVVHLWRIRLSQFSEDVEHLRKYVSSTEERSAAQFLNPVHGSRYLLTKALQRMILSRYLIASPKEIEFTKGLHGKPFLNGVESLEFNLSHSGDLVLLGVTDKTAIGVDVEKVRDVLNVEAVVSRFFSEKEKYLFSFCESSEKRKAFYQMWVRKEAFVKATGDGLGFPLSGFSVGMDGSEAANHLLAVHNEKASPQKWLIRGLDLDNDNLDYAAAFSVQGGISRLVCWDLGRLARESELF